VYPVAVQGEVAPREIAEALALAGTRRDCDVLIVARGGGSLEDLWAFNDESVARAIFACLIPIVSGVGHEVDVTIADFVADERAPTPSAAAERVVPDRGEWLRALAATDRRLALAMRRRLGDQRHALLLRRERLGRAHPGVILRQQSQRLDELAARLALAGRSRLERAGAKLTVLQSLLRRASPALRTAALRLRLDVTRRALAAAARGSVVQARRRFELAARTLDAVSPLATLDRGYAIVSDTAGRVLQDAAALQPGDGVTARLARGRFRAQVVAVLSGEPSETGTEK
jgi:exodeoxyribonuclease VII large subunit